MCTAHLLPISPSMHYSWGVYLVLEGVPAREDVPAWGMYLVTGDVPARGGVPGPGGSHLPGGRYLSGGVPVQGVYLSRYPPLEQNSWNMLLKILPSPKLRLRAVKILNITCAISNAPLCMMSDRRIVYLTFTVFWTLNVRVHVIFQPVLIPDQLIIHLM